MQPIIRVEELGKSYRIGERQGPPRSLRELFSERVSFRSRSERRARAAQAASSTELWALRDINFDVQAGDVVGIVGRNGSGKSTLLKILSRISEPTCGRFQLRGRIASLLEVGTGFHPELTGRENIYLNGAILGMRREEIARDFDEIVSFAEVERFVDTPVKHYSSGMYMRLAFSVASQLESEILFVDEVLAVGDAAFQKKCMARMRAAAHAGRTVLFVSHNMAAVTALCDKAIALQQGALIYSGDVDGAVGLYDVPAGPDMVEWNGSAGDEDVQVVRTWARSLAADGTMHTAAAIEIGVELDVLQPIEQFILSFWLLSSYDYELAYCRYDDNDNSKPPLIPPGRMVKRWIIPADTLGAGTYTVRWALGLHMIKHIINGPEGSLTFTLQNTQGVGRRFVSPQGRGFVSLLRPNWEVR
ncbi:MAG: Polysaccharide transporter, ATP-binding protein [Gemmatimonadetes bacterium]|nr:Polysaccharide transporter, ATP-binding protein [Gemmatimonadota bacterium]